jgi:hypothetical protein
MNYDQNEMAQKQIMGAISREYPRIQPGQLIDVAAIRLRLRDAISDQDFIFALEALPTIGLLRMDGAGALALTDLGFRVVAILNSRSRTSHNSTTDKVDSGHSPVPDTKSVAR